MTAFEHLSDERVQAFLDGELSQRETAHVQDHVSSCARCASEVEAWRLLFDELVELPALEPSIHLADRVLGGLPRRAPTGLRIPGWVLGGRTISETEHLVADRLQDYIDGALSGQGHARAAAHLEGCGSCRDELSGWSQLFVQLEGLTELDPAPDFAEQVMHRVQVRPRSVAVRQSFGARARLWGAMLAEARRRASTAVARAAPRSRRAWAVIASFAAAPTVAVAAVAMFLFSHPLLTPGYLASFLWWKATGLAGIVSGWALDLGGQASDVVLSNAAVRALSATPSGLALAAVGVTALMTVSLWVLYKNLFASSTSDRYARIAS